MNNLTEGLRKNDLQDCIYPFFEVDTFKSKMGEDADVVTLVFQAKDRFPAKDLMEFLEKGYSFVLDSDVSAGENEEGEYSIFVEIQRTSKIAENINEMIFGISRLTGIDDWKFKYYKSKDKKEATLENLKKIPNNKNMYESLLQKFRTDEMRSFFNKTLMDDFELDGNIITIHKPFNIKYQFEIIKQGDNSLAESLDNPQNTDESVAEIFWLTKVLGNYNINSFGEGFLLTNENKSILLKRK